MKEELKKDIKKRIAILKIHKLFKSCFVVGISEDSVNPIYGKSFRLSVIMYEHIITPNVAFRKTYTYYYFNRSYKSQYLLHPELTGDILIQKYPDNTIYNVIKDFI